MESPLRFEGRSTQPAHWPLGLDLPAFCPQITPIGPFLPVMPVCKYCAVYHLRFELFHGMEEVVGSIPTRSTKDIQKRIRYLQSPV